MRKRIAKSSRSFHRGVHPVTASKRVRSGRQFTGKRITASYEDPVTSDLAKFGRDELEELRNLLDAWLKYGLPDDFLDDKVVPMFNQNSGFVFLSNSDYQTCLLTDNGKLESWYLTPYNGYEGFYEDLCDECDDWDEADDLEYLRDIAESRNDNRMVDHINELIENLE